MRDRYAFEDSYQQGGVVGSQDPFGSLQQNPLPRQPQAAAPGAGPQKPPPIFGQSLPDPRMKSGIMGAVNPAPPKLGPKKYGQEMQAKKNLSGGYPSEPFGSLLSPAGRGAPGKGPLQGPPQGKQGPPQGGQDQQSQGNQWLSQLWEGVLGDVSSQPEEQQQPTGFGEGGGVSGVRRGGALRRRFDNKQSSLQENSRLYENEERKRRLREALGGVSLDLPHPQVGPSGGYPSPGLPSGYQYEFARGGAVGLGIPGHKGEMIRRRMRGPASSAEEIYAQEMARLNSSGVESGFPADMRELDITNPNVSPPQQPGSPAEFVGGSALRQGFQDIIPRPEFDTSLESMTRDAGIGVPRQAPAPSQAAQLSQMDELGMGDFYRDAREPMQGPRQYPYEDFVNRAAGAHEVDPDLVRAVIMQESGGNPNAKSRTGALGLMQLMPDAASDMGISPDERLDPGKNVMAGTKYLRMLLDKYDGNMELALAAYNAGMTNVDRYGGVPPFDETQKYVQNVPRRMKKFAHGGGIGDLRSQSQEIASRGRYGDSVLMHVTPEEVSGIESAIGRPLTRNPDTGNPEAYGVGISLLIGAVLGAGLGGAGGYAAGGDWQSALMGAGVGAVGGAAGGALGGAAAGPAAGTAAGTAASTAAPATAAGSGLLMGSTTLPAAAFAGSLPAAATAPALAAGPSLGSMLGATASGATSGAGLASSLAQPVMQATAKPPKQTNIVDPFVSSQMKGARGSVTSAMANKGSAPITTRVPSIRSPVTQVAGTGGRGRQRPGLPGRGLTRNRYLRS